MTTTSRRVLVIVPFAMSADNLLLRQQQLSCSLRVRLLCKRCVVLELYIRRELTRAPRAVPSVK